MRMPRQVSGRQLADALTVLGYSITRQKGSHMRYTTTQRGRHHVTVPDHRPVKTGTLHGFSRMWLPIMA